MRQFFKFLFASMLGFVLGSILLIFILVGIISAAVNSFDDEKVTDVKSNSMLFLDFQKPIVDRASKNPFENISFASFNTEGSNGLNNNLENLRKAKEDKNIKGIYMELSTINSGIATVEEIRNALIDFKKSGKAIISYSEVYTQKSYYLASVADKIYMNPQGAMELKGLGAEIMFYKGLLDKIEVETQVIRHGRYKSAVEPFILDKMSADNRIQTRAFMQNIWNFMVGNIAASLKISVGEARARRFGLIIDVRTPKERELLGYYPNSIPVELNTNIPKNTWILVYSGDNRAANAAEALHKLGYINVRYITESYNKLMPGY